MGTRRFVFGLAAAGLALGVLALWAAKLPRVTEIYTVAAGADDALERLSDGRVAAGGASLPLGQGWLAGFRFTGLGLPPGARIVSARLRFFAVSGAGRDVGLTYRAQAAGGAASFAALAGDLSRRAVTAALVKGQPVSWADGAWAESPDLAALVQEVVADPCWSRGRALVLLVRGAGGAGRAIASRENPLNRPAELVISWGEPAGAPAPASVAVWSARLAP